MSRLGIRISAPVNHCSAHPRDALRVHSRCSTPTPSKHHITSFLSSFCVNGCTTLQCHYYGLSSIRTGSSMSIFHNAASITTTPTAHGGRKRRRDEVDHCELDRRPFAIKVRSAGLAWSESMLTTSCYRILQTLSPDPERLHPSISYHALISHSHTSIPRKLGVEPSPQTFMPSSLMTTNQTMGRRFSSHSRRRRRGGMQLNAWCQESMHYAGLQSG